MIKVGIIGGAGYTAGELLRLLVNHPDVEIVFVNSSSNAGNKLYNVHSGLIGETDMAFTSELPFESIDLLFFCTAHGDTKKFMDLHEEELPKDLKIIDLSMDYRIESDEHEFVYGLPELNRKRIIRCNRVANPGCFATAIQLALLPLAENRLLTDDIQITGITGSTGAGQKPTETTHYSWRNDNISVYKPFKHQHLNEIGFTIKSLQPDFNGDINFIPVRGCFARGIFITAYTKCSLPIEEIKALYQEAYSDHSFTFITDKSPDLKQVVNTNKALIYLEKCGDKLLIISCIDNLLKGASGQAVHNMNLLFGLTETTGLKLKPMGF
ncbi:MAG: N-acetyl-gamma-glutamyl-phosphate reductase [Bacteroidales bacterium]|nr:N-acetyl-gamma-glutamyl-phosphate reductase [Bacteroidales bacterium]